MRDRLTSWPAWSLCQMAAVRARIRYRSRARMPSSVRPPCPSSSSWALRVWLTDSMTWRSGLNSSFPVLGASPLRRPEQHQATVRDCLLEVPAEVVLVPDQGLTGAGVHQSGVDLQHGEQGLALVGLRSGDGEHDGQAVQGADQVEPKAPEVPGVT